LAGGPVLSQGVAARAWRKSVRAIAARPWQDEITGAYIAAFRDRPAAVLAQYGPTGARVTDACRRAGLPLIVHFHGYDASVRSVLAENAAGYARMFVAAAAIIGVSHDMCARLIDLGAPAEKVHYCPCSVDCEQFAPADPAAAGPVIVAAGRLVDKKAPHLLLLAFAEIVRQRPEARLRLIGDGPLMGACRDLVSALNLDRAVTLLGNQPHEVIRDELRRARCFAQHSVTALNGDAEGTPVAVMEAGASGLPAVCTRHAGIVDVVVDGVTGYLTDERDVRAMAAGLLRLVDSPALAARMGAAARVHVEARFSMDRQIARLWEIVAAAIEGRAPSPAREAAATPLPAGV
jgi:glycosyltransferase involved in cell wall biosynthesis